jgi:hypothetical protein
MKTWQYQHQDAMLSPNAREKPVVDMVRSWIDYRKQHKARYDSDILEDYVLGPEWRAIGNALLGLLNGETGRLDCGTLDSLIRMELTPDDN